MNIENEQLYQWIFNYNPYTQDWRAVKREDYIQLFSDNDEIVLKSSKIDTLVEIIKKTNGKLNKLNIEK